MKKLLFVVMFTVVIITNGYCKSIDRNIYEFVTFKRIAIENFPQLKSYKYKNKLLYIVYNSNSFYTAINFIRIKNHKKPLRIEFLRLMFLQWIQTESGFNQNAISESGCYGLLQIKYSTWKNKFHIRNYRQLLNYRTNLRISKLIFIEYLEKSKGDIHKALKFYNEGPYSKNILASNYSNKIINGTNKKINKTYIFFDD